MHYRPTTETNSPGFPRERCTQRPNSTNTSPLTYCHNLPRCSLLPVTIAIVLWRSSQKWCEYKLIPVPRNSIGAVWNGWVCALVAPALWTRIQEGWTQYRGEGNNKPPHKINWIKLSFLLSSESGALSRSFWLRTSCPTIKFHADGVYMYLPWDEKKLKLYLTSFCSFVVLSGKIIAAQVGSFNQMQPPFSVGKLGD